MTNDGSPKISRTATLYSGNTVILVVCVLTFYTNIEDWLQEQPSIDHEKRV